MNILDRKSSNQKPKKQIPSTKPRQTEKTPSKKPSVSKTQKKLALLMQKINSMEYSDFVADWEKAGGLSPDQFKRMKPKPEGNAKDRALSYSLYIRVKDQIIKEILSILYDI